MQLSYYISVCVCPFLILIRRCFWILYQTHNMHTHSSNKIRNNKTNQLILRCIEQIFKTGVNWSQKDRELLGCWEITKVVLNGQVELWTSLQEQRFWCPRTSVIRKGIWDLMGFLRTLNPFVQGLVTVPFWIYWTSSYSSHYRPYT